MNKFKYNFDTVTNYILEKGYKLLSETYTSSQVPLIIQCPKGHIIKPCFSEFKRKERCNECSISAKPSLDKIKQFVSNKGFTLISDKYINNHTKLNIKCSKGHIWGITWNNLMYGNGCPDCYGNRRHTIDEVKEYLEPFDYQLSQNTFQNVSEKIKLICPKGHHYSQRFADFKDGHRCILCSHQTSNAEKEILSFIHNFYPLAKKVKYKDIINNCPQKYSNKELDIYIPELKIAIEYCGLYWHSEISGYKSPSQHKDKLIWCRAHNIRFITIFEDEWLTRKDQVKNLLLSVLGQYTVKIGARICDVKEISTSIAKEFVNKYHIQSLHSCKIAFGLFYKEELIGIITGNKHHRQKQNEFVLQRLCFKNSYQISGGASKLLQKLLNYCKENNYIKLISWSDNRISEGNVYTKLNFSLVIEYKPDYSYVLNGYYDKRYSKQSLKKTPKERLSGKTEVELRKEQGYYRIWDCGKKLWVLSI